jgi:hypothetical protein
MKLKLKRRHILESPPLSSEWLGAAVLATLALALLVGALAITNGVGTDVQSEDDSHVPNYLGPSNAGLALISAKPTSTARVIKSPVPNTSDLTPSKSPRSRPTSTPSPQPPKNVTAKPQAQAKKFVFRFGAADWRGGYFRGDTEWYGRAWTAVYGTSSPSPRASLNVYLTAIPRAPASLTISGLDDEWSGTNPISISVNGVEIFSGPSPFANWDGIGLGEQAVWSEISFAVPKGVLHEGANEIAVANLSPTANFSSPPYVLVSNAILEIDI